MNVSIVEIVQTFLPVLPGDKDRIETANNETLRETSFKKICI